MKKIISSLMIVAVLITGISYASPSKVEASLASVKYFFNGVQKTPSAETPILIHNETTYVPLRFVAETLGAEVEYDAKTHAVNVTEKGHSKVPTNTINEAKVSYENGVYRGSFDYEGSQQVAVQFELKDNLVQNIKFAYLYYKGVDYKAEKEDAKIIGLRTQYEELINHLVGKDIRVSLNHLYEPAKIVKTEVDTVTGATVRSGKVISAIRDSLNRGVYSYPKK